MMMIQVDDLLKQRDGIHSSFTVVQTLNVSGSSGSGKTPDEAKTESPAEDLDGKEKSSKKRWFNLNLKGSDKKIG